MLVLTRKLGESIAINDDIKIVVMQIKGKQVRLGINASPSTVIHREEVYRSIFDENKLASCTKKSSLNNINPFPKVKTEGSLVKQVPIKKRIRQ